MQEGRAEVISEVVQDVFNLINSSLVVAASLLDVFLEGE
jgi:hypothetical protein